MVEGDRFEIYCRENSLPRVRIPLSPPHSQQSSLFLIKYGEVTEWLKVLAWNAGVGQPTEGSNPSFTAIYQDNKKYVVIRFDGRVPVTVDP